MVRWGRAERSRRPAGPGSSESAATAEAATTAETAATGSRTAKASARSRREASRAWWPWWTILARARFADRQRPALKRLRVELADDFLRLVTVHELDERESARTTGLAIDRHGDVGGLCDGCEVGAEIGLTRTVGEVPDEQTDCQGLLVKSPLLASGVRFYLKDTTAKVKGQRAKVKGQGKGQGRSQEQGGDVGGANRARDVNEANGCRSAADDVFGAESLCTQLADAGVAGRLAQLLAAAGP